MSDEYAAVETLGATKRFDDRLAVAGVDLRVVNGSVYGLLGRNGAGKTTLLRIVLGLLSADSGTVRIFGHDAPAGDVASRQVVSGFVEEPRFYPYLSAEKNLELLARLDGDVATLSPTDALELVELAGRGRDKVGNFSTGMRQRLGLAAALVRSPRLLVVDEPTIGLDPASAASVRGLLRNLASAGVAVLMSSHNMAEVAEICDRVLIIHEGRMVWEGSQVDLHNSAPVPSWRVWTSDDEIAMRTARRMNLHVDEGGWLSGGAAVILHADDDARDAYVLALAAQQVAVRQLEPDRPPLELLFTALTGAVSDSGEVAA